MTEQEVVDAGTAIAGAIEEILQNPRLKLGGDARSPAAFTCAFRSIKALVDLFDKIAYNK